MTEFKVTALARLRKQHDQEFAQYWVAGKCWSAFEPTTHILTVNQLEALKKEEAEGMPIHLVSVESLVPFIITPLPASTVKTIIPPPGVPPPWAPHN